MKENKKLRDENNELRTQGRGLSVLSSDHDAADVKFTPCIRGLCNVCFPCPKTLRCVLSPHQSADEVRTLARLKNELEVELASCRSALQEKVHVTRHCHLYPLIVPQTSSLEDLRQKVNDLNHQYHVSTEELSALRQVKNIASAVVWADLSMRAGVCKFEAAASRPAEWCWRTWPLNVNLPCTSERDAYTP